MIELGGVYERVGTEIEKGNEQDCVVDAVDQWEVWMNIQYQIICMHWQVANCTECADKYHGLDDVGLHLM